MYMYAYEVMCLYACLCTCTHERMHTHTQAYTHISVCLCVRVSVSNCVSALVCVSMLTVFILFSVLHYLTQFLIFVFNCVKEQFLLVRLLNQLIVSFL